MITRIAKRDYFNIVIVKKIWSTVDFHPTRDIAYNESFQLRILIVWRALKATMVNFIIISKCWTPNVNRICSQEKSIVVNDEFEHPKKATQK
jgi:hypothetical protein